MILGVSHAVFSGTDLAASQEALVQLGFTPSFRELDVPNPVEKKPFLHTWVGQQSLAYYKGTAGPALELVQHGELAAGRSAYELILKVPAHAVAEAPQESLFDAVSEALGFSPAPLPLPGTGSAVWIQPSPEGEAFVQCALLPARDLEAARRFWMEGAGARSQANGTTRSGHPWHLLRLGALLPAWKLDLLLLAKTPDSPLPMMDMPGMTCLTLLTNRMDADTSRLEQHGASFVSPRFALPVNGQELAIRLLRGPGGEPVELIQLPEKR